MNADVLVRERTGQRHPAELTTPIVTGQHLSVFIRGSHFVTIVQLCPVLLTPSKSHVVPTELLVLISVPFWFGLLQWDKELLDFEFVADFELRTSVYCPPLCQT